MVAHLTADASPEKRLFISLITRDISLADAILDLIDNSINAAIEPYAERLKTAADYFNLLTDASIEPNVRIDIGISEDEISLTDNATGISSKTAQEHVFKFGRGENDSEQSDRLSVYGIGLKRAMFKLGNKIDIVSDHAVGGFSLKLDVAAWAKLLKQPWTFDLLVRPPVEPSKCGTAIRVKELTPDVKRRVADGVFPGQLRDRISRTYAFFIGRLVRIYVGGVEVPATAFDLGANMAASQVTEGTVTATITAGIADTGGERFNEKTAGWYIFCNGRTVVYADKSELTGWSGGGGMLPSFQPKHRPFLGIVFFVSATPEDLPWTTTKSAINEESSVWQIAKRSMVVTGREITSFLDKRYNEDGTTIQLADLRDAAGTKTSALSASVMQKRAFDPPKKPKPPEIRIQYSAKEADVQAISTYLRRPYMSGAEVGRYTFDYFLKNQVR